MSRFRSIQIPLRLRLTLWYTFSLGLILLLFTAFLYVQVRRSLIAQVNAALNLAANQALIRLFLNLLDNAVKYTPENGRVTIQAAGKRPFIQITVSDSGPGIAEEHLPHLFERFYRVESDRARQAHNDDQSGAGLGLAIAYEIARAHGGGLTVQSEVEVGTTFVVQLPENDSATFVT